MIYEAKITQIDESKNNETKTTYIVDASTYLFCSNTKAKQMNVITNLQERNQLTLLF